MRTLLLILSLLLTPLMAMRVAAQDPQVEDGLEVLVDSSSTDGVDAFSDTTAVDTGTIEFEAPPGYQHHDSLDDWGEQVDMPFSFIPGVLMFLTFLVPLLIILIPILVVLFIIYLIVRQGKRRRRYEPLNSYQRQDTQTKDYMPTNKKLCRSNDRILGGVCAGLAEYVDIDPTVVRVLYVLLTFFTAFSGVIIYIILLLVMPQKHF